MTDELLNQKSAPEMNVGSAFIVFVCFPNSNWFSKTVRQNWEDFCGHKFFHVEVITNCQQYFYFMKFFTSSSFPVLWVLQD